MRLSRLVPVLAAGALVVASTSPVQAQTDPVSGVGTTTGALTLLGLDAGELLALELLTDAGAANIDEATGPRNAAAQIAALALDTAATEPLSVPLLSVSSTGDEQRAGQDMALPANPFVSGSVLPLSLAALVDEASARSTLAASLTDLDVLGGVASLASSNLDLGTSAATADAAGARGVDVGALTVLDLQALLELLGIPLTDLPLDTLLGLLDSLGLLGQLEAVLAPLGVDIRDLGTAQIAELFDSTIGGIVDEVGTVVDDVDAVLVDLGTTAEPVCEITDSVDGVVDGIDGVVDGIGGVVNGIDGDGGGVVGLSTDVSAAATCTAPLDATAAVKDLTAQLEVLLNQVQDLLDQILAILEAPLDLLSGVALLSLDGLDVTVLTKATDDIETSSADVTGTLGNLKVGELPALGALDLTATTAQLDDLLGQAEGLIGGILGEIAPALSDLVTIRSMQETTSVEQVGDSIVSSASFSGLEVDVLPILGELTALLGNMGGEDSIAGIIDGLGLGLDLATSGVPAIEELNTLLAPVTGQLSLLGALASLEDGLGLQVATLSQRSTFTPVAASAPVTPDAPGAPAAPAAPSPTLPRTGSSDTLLLALAGAAVLAALGGRQLVRRADGNV